MRVIHVSPTAFGSSGLFGGGERYALELARAVARRADCRLVTFGSHASSYRDGPLDVRVLDAALRVRGHPAHPLARGLLRTLEDGDVIHVHHLRALPSRIATLAAVVRRQGCVATDHGLGPGRLPGLDARVVDRFLTVSRYSASTLRSPPSKTAVIYGGADTDRFHPAIGEERHGVLYVGRVTPHKGIDRLIKALPDGATLTIAGTSGHDPRPPERDYPELLRSLARDRDVRFAGRVAEADLPALYRHARVLVLPSVNETCYGKRVAIPELLGLTLLEAMASGTPVIASDVGGLAEAVVDGVTGFMVEPGDIAELTARLEQLLDDARLLTEMSDNARRHVETNFTWDKCAERCVSIYEDVMGAA